LFKRSRLSELKRGLYTKTEWGNVRPSWHIQGIAMAMKYFGEGYDLHASSRELAFPHHENEIAIARALIGSPLAGCWALCDRVLADGKKADARSAGLTLATLIAQGYTAREIRYWLLSGHYRKPLIFSAERIADARQALRRLDACVQNLLNVEDGRPFAELDQLLYDIRQGFVGALDDDLNMALAAASLFRNVKRVNILIFQNQLGAEDALKILEAFRSIDAVLKIFDFTDVLADPETQRLITAREKARRNGNWDEADRLRDQLQRRGVTVRDAKLPPGT
jgi:cysteinyl-tRNA synthetase